MRGTGEPRVDQQITSGLTGVANSAAYRIHEVERHFHGRERWYGKKAVQTATDWADNVINNPFRAISGNNVYGADPNDEAQVIGTADTPVIAGMVQYDVHRLFIVACSVTTPAKLRFVYGAGTMAAAIAAEQYSTIMIRVDAAVGSTPAVPVDVVMPRCACGSCQVWVQFWSITDNATLDFYAGWHEYEG